MERATRLADRSIALARATGDPSVVASALRASVSLTLRPRGIQQRLERARELAELTGVVADERFGAGTYFRSAACYIVGDREGIEAAERDHAELSLHWGSYWRYWIECVRYGRHFMAGRLTEARDACARVSHVERTFRSGTASGANAVQRYMVRREAGALESVRELITGEESLTSTWVPGLLALYTELEMEQPARQAMTWLMDQDSPALHESADWPAALAFLVEAAVWLEDAATAARLRPLVAEYHGLNLLSGHFIALFGSADRYLASIDSLLGEPGAEALFDAALELDTRCQAQLHVATTHTAYARHLRRTDPGSTLARELEQKARDIAEPLGLVRVLRALDRNAHAQPCAPDGLTSREVEVIRLLAAGMSNRSLASQLFISEHTAANHVRSILMKTGAGNRTQAARYAHDHGLV